MTDYKVLRKGKSCHGGTGTWRKGKPRSVAGKLEPCRNGLHYCRDEQVLFWLGEELWEWEDLTPEECLEQNGKRCTRRGMVTRKYETWNKRTRRLFAVDCLRTIVDDILPDSGDRELVHACLDIAAGYADGLLDDTKAAREAVTILQMSREDDEPLFWADILGATFDVLGGSFISFAECSYAGYGYPDSLMLEVDQRAAYRLLCRYLAGEEGPFIDREGV